MINFCANCGKRNLYQDGKFCVYCGYELQKIDKNNSSKQITTVPPNLKRYFTNNTKLFKTNANCINCKKDIYSISTNNEKHLICLNCGIDFIDLNNVYYLNSIANNQSAIWIYYHNTTLNWNKWKNVPEIIKFIENRRKQSIQQNKIPDNLVKNYKKNLKKVSPTDIECPYCHEIKLYNINEKWLLINYPHLICLNCGLDLQKNKLEKKLYLLKDFGNEKSILWIENQYKLKPLNEWIKIIQESNEKEYFKYCETDDD